MFQTILLVLVTILIVVDAGLTVLSYRSTERQIECACQATNELRTKIMSLEFQLANLEKLVYSHADQLQKKKRKTKENNGTNARNKRTSKQV